MSITTVVTKQELSNTTKLLVFKLVFDLILTYGNEYQVITKSAILSTTKIAILITSGRYRIFFKAFMV